MNNPSSVMDSYTLSQEDLDRITSKIKTHSDVQAAIDSLKEENASSVFDILMATISIFSASDIHIDANAKGARIRIRIDGMLHDVATMNAHLFSLILSRVKIISRLKININKAQDGKFSLERPDVKIEIRVSTVPSEFGEDIALRILDPRSLISVEELGVRKDLHDQLLQQLQKPQGLTLITGPTGAGKTTTLYAILKYLQKPALKIVTIEDPVEYHLPGVSQTQIDEYSEYTFAEGIRAMLRQDPDIVMVGELREEESLKAALRASLAGRRVFSTLHTNDSFGAIPRMLDMGAEKDTIATGLNMSIAQRLVRKLCSSCKVNIQASPEAQQKLRATTANLALPETLQNFTSVCQPSEQGCEPCNGTGYKGRVGLFEMYSVTREIAPYITSGITELEFMRMLTSRGVTTIKQDGVIRILSGETSIAEVERVLGALGQIQ